jgi:putative aldouronate transport system substrate-binding protein
MKKTISVILALILTLSASTFAFASDQNAFAPYADKVKVTIGRENYSSLALPNGDTFEKNKYIDFLENGLNIDIEYEWLADSSAYNQKVNLAIASGDIPDIMYINSEAQIKQLVENDLIEDLTPYMDAYFSDHLNAFYTNYGAYGLESGLYNDKLMALPNLNGGYEFSFLWVRKDWVEKLGAQMPTTLDEVVNLAKLFIEKDPNGNGEGKTIGIAVNTAVTGVYNNLGNLDPIFGTFNAFPRQWVRGADGKVTYGTTTDNTKAALEYVAGLYSQGVLDKEFAVRTGDDFNALLLSGRCGMFFGPWWMPDWPLSSSKANDPNSDWVPVLAPLDAIGNFNAYRQKANNQWLVVRKGYEHPEIVFKMLSYTIAHQNDTEVTNFYPDTSVLWIVWPVIIMLRNETAIPDDYKLLTNAIEKRDPTGLTVEMTNVYNQCIEYLTTKDPAGWQVYTCRAVGPSITTSDKVVTVDNIYPAFSETMELTWSSMKKLEDELILKTIMGEMSINDFGAFVDKWMQLGGSDITAEVNAQYAK